MPRFYDWNNLGPSETFYWWGAPTGWTDLDLYDYNNNLMLDDNEIADIVRDNIFDDPYITLSDTNSIQVDVDDGVVTLSGNVRNPRSKPLAYTDAFWSSGVIDVVNNIQVKSRTASKSTGKTQNNRNQKTAHMTH